MRIVAGSDWRDGLEFETPVLVAELVPGEPVVCFACGPASAPRPRTELWAVKHRHPKNHSGFVRFYCAAHRPAPPRREPEPVATSARAPRGSSARAAAPHRPTVVEKPAVLCPDCFVEVPATGVCGMCGREVA